MFGASGGQGGVPGEARLGRKDGIPGVRAGELATAERQAHDGLRTDTEKTQRSLSFSPSLLFIENLLCV